MVTSEIEQRRRGRPRVPDPTVSKRAAVRRYQQRERERKDYMTQVTKEAARVHEMLCEQEGEQLCLPLQVVGADPLQTLRNIANHLDDVAHARKRARKNRKEVAK
jgi:hypothetical protein